METLKRGSEIFKVNRSLTQRYRNSAIPTMKRMLNVHEKQRQKIMKEISLPVNRGFCKSLSLQLQLSILLYYFKIFPFRCLLAMKMMRHEQPRTLDAQVKAGPSSSDLLQKVLLLTGRDKVSLIACLIMLTSPCFLW